MTIQNEEMTRGLGWLDLDGMHEGKRRKDSGGKGLGAMLPTLKMTPRRLEAGHLRGPVPAGSAVLWVLRFPWGAGELGKGFVERAGGSWSS